MKIVHYLASLYLLVSIIACKENKTEASKQVEGASPDDLSPLSEDITKELEKKAP